MATRQRRAAEQVGLLKGDRDEAARILGCRISPYRIVLSFPADSDDMAAELERDGWSVVPIVPSWTTSVNVVPTDHGCFRGETFKHVATRCPLTGA